MGLPRGMAPRAGCLEHHPFHRHPETPRKAQDKVTPCVGARWIANKALRSSLQMPMSGNEALHATMRNALRQVHDVHRSVLCLKLHLFMHSQQIARDAAIRTPALRQMHRNAVLARVFGRQFIDEQNWDAESSPLTISGVVLKEHGPLPAQRKECVRVFAPRRKSKKGRTFVKRTAFDARRKSHLSGKNCK